MRYDLEFDKLVAKNKGIQSIKEPVYFLGWTSGNEGDEKLLRSFGVDGRMLWYPPKREEKKGHFSHCRITMEVAHILKEQCPWFGFGHFTGVDEEGKQTLDQPFNRWRYNPETGWSEN